jgi:hypothetical protein
MDGNENKKTDYVLMDMELGYNLKNVIFMYEDNMINNDHLNGIQFSHKEELN